MKDDLFKIYAVQTQQKQAATSHNDIYDMYLCHILSATSITQCSVMFTKFWVHQTNTCIFKKIKFTTNVRQQQTTNKWNNKYIHQLNWNCEAHYV